MRQFKREPLTPDEANRLASACETQLERFVVWTLLDTGLRVAELCRLDGATSLDWQQHRLIVFGKGGPYGSNSKRRVVPMSPRVASIVEPMLGLHGSVSKLFGVRTVQRMLKPIANRAQISRPVTPHVLRHTFAVECNRKGLSSSAIQRLLGHDSLQTTEIYLNMSPEHVFEEFRAKW